MKFLMGFITCALFVAFHYNLDAKAVDYEDAVRIAYEKGREDALRTADDIGILRITQADVEDLIE